MAGCPADGSPLSAGWKRRTATAHQLRLCDLGNDRCRSHRARFLERGETARRTVGLEALRIDPPDAAEQRTGFENPAQLVAGSNEPADICGADAADRILTDAVGRVFRPGE